MKPYVYDAHDESELEHTRALQLQLLAENPELERLKLAALEHQQEAAASGTEISGEESGSFLAELNPAGWLGWENEEKEEGEEEEKEAPMNRHASPNPDLGRWIGWTSSGGRGEETSSPLAPPPIQPSRSPELVPNQGSPSQMVPPIDSRMTPPHLTASQRSPSVPALPVSYVASPRVATPSMDEGSQALPYVPSPRGEEDIAVDPHGTWSPHPIYIGRRTFMPRCMECEPEEGWVSYYRRTAVQLGNQSYFGVPAWQLAVGAKAAKAAALVAICL